MKIALQIVKCNSINIFAVILGLAYFYGVLSTQHYAPSILDLYIGLGITIALCTGLLIVILYSKIVHVSYTTIICVFFTLLIVCQPLISVIDYSDSLLFPFNALLLMTCLSIVITNIESKSIIIAALLASLYLGGILTVCTQLLQLFSSSYPEWLESLVFYGTDSTRPYGNVGQPNQAAYIIAMALIAANYWFLRVKNQSQLPIVFWIALLIVSVVFLGIGQGLSSSRGGLILSLVACLGTVILYQASLKKRLLFFSFILALITFGNWLGTKLLLNYAVFQQTALDRVISTNTSRPLRWYLQEQAWLTFSTDWLTGAGWNNLPKVALANAESLNRFVFATNTHFLPSQIAAELGLIGIVGLLGLGFVIFRGVFRSNHNLETKTMTILIILSLLYACSEYPFWYMRFLLLFTCLVALLDNTKLRVKFRIKPIMMTYLIVLLIGSVFYMNSYRQYVAVDNLIKRADVKDYEAQILVEQLNNIYGFSKFKEIMMFRELPVNSSNIKPFIALGNRVISNYLDPDLITRQAMLLALDNQNQESLKLYKAACLYEFFKYCGQVENELRGLSFNQPKIFFAIYNDFETWRTDTEN